MTKGRETCNILKEIRQQIADHNNINFEPSECHFEGECQGTCPKCESEVRYLESEIKKKGTLKKVAAVAGISLGIAMTFSSCTTGDPDIEGDPIPPRGVISETLNSDYSDNDSLLIEESDR